MEPTALLTELIAIKPVSSDIPAVNRAEERLGSLLKAEGLFCTFETDEKGRKVLFAATENTKCPDLLLNAHLDVVPAADEKQYVPEIREERLCARGSSDCLGNAVCIAGVLLRMKGRASVGAVFTADEEIGGMTTVLMVQRGYSAKKAVIVMDHNGDDGVTLAQKGIVTLKLTARGKGGHSSAPWAFDNPIDKLVRGYGKLLDQWKNPLPGETWNNSMAACMISGGQIFNQIPDTASMTLNFRFICEGDDRKILETVRSVTGLEAEVENFSPCVSFSDDNSTLEKLRSVKSRFFPEKKICFHRMDGATDARHLKDLGIPLAVMGVRGGGAHSAAEYVELPSIGVYTDILCEFAEKM